MALVASISGFPEWLPEQQLVEERFLEVILSQLALAGYTPLRTRSVEPLDVLLKKGETEKEIYVLSRLHAEDGDRQRQLGLHFDLTVPFARYVAERIGSLTFPLKRYQIQLAWRGERPQEGRFREFLQADVDVVGRGNVPLIHDIELAGLLVDILDRLPIPAVTILVNNRKIMDGFCQGLGIDDVPGTLRKIDKLAKIGAAKVESLLREHLDEGQTRALLELCQIRTSDTSFVEKVRSFGIASKLLEQGLTELAAVIDGNVHLRSGAVRADLSIARGFDYYTGTVYEGVMNGFEHIGAVCSGGRYDNLVSQSGRHRESFPGVGVSIGVSRILGILMGRGMLVASRSTPACVLVTLNSAEHQGSANMIARRLRSRSIAVDVFHEPVRYAKQIEYAQKKGIPYVWFHDVEGDGRHAVRLLSESTQVEADPETWVPRPDLLRPQILSSPGTA
jgi:histidyl-tRNA synthetase